MLSDFKPLAFAQWPEQRKQFPSIRGATGARPKP
jgi:hypothetical protein